MPNETIVFGGGCFWCTEAIFRELTGVSQVVSGYAGGTQPDPTYEEVCSGNTGHAEVIKITFDPDIIPLKVLLDVFFSSHDPTSLNQQGNDIGTQYRSIILYTNPEQLPVIKKNLKSGYVTEVKPLAKFYPAENYHQQYYDKNASAPYCQVIISPKLQKIRKNYSSLLR
jgi:peptide-methionine (S)-S-oxide reductase